MAGARPRRGAPVLPGQRPLGSIHAGRGCRGTEQPTAGRPPLRLPTRAAGGRASGGLSAAAGQGNPRPAAGADRRKAADRRQAPRRHAGQPVLRRHPGDRAVQLQPADLHPRRQLLPLRALPAQRGVLRADHYRLRPALPLAGNPRAVGTLLRPFRGAVLLHADAVRPALSRHTPLWRLGLGGVHQPDRLLGCGGAHAAAGTDPGALSVHGQRRAAALRRDHGRYAQPVDARQSVRAAVQHRLEHLARLYRGQPSGAQRHLATQCLDAEWPADRHVRRVRAAIHGAGRAHQRRAQPAHRRAATGIARLGIAGRGARTALAGQAGGAGSATARQRGARSAGVRTHPCAGRSPPRPGSRQCRTDALEHHRFADPAGQPPAFRSSAGRGNPPRAARRQPTIGVARRYRSLQAGQRQLRPPLR